jgi:hypothetical protein
MAGKIFINYRRGDEPGFAQALLGRLEQAFPADRLFIDVDSIPPGEDFVQVIESQIALCDVLLAMIGKSWVHVKDERGRRRLDDPNDFVRIEIESALRQGKRVIPVLVHYAQMPRADELPEAIRPLATRNAVRLTHERFRADVQGLVKALERALDETDVPRLRRERDEALQQLSAVRIQLENVEKERLTQAKRNDDLLLQIEAIENDRREEASKARRQASTLEQTISELKTARDQAVADLADFRTRFDASELELTRLKAQIPGLSGFGGRSGGEDLLNKPVQQASSFDTATRGGTASQSKPPAQKSGSKLSATEVDGLFRTSSGYAVQLDRNTALVQNYGVFYVFPSLAEYRQKYGEYEEWTEVTDRDEKRKFFASAQQACSDTDMKCPALDAIDANR